MVKLSIHSPVAALAAQKSGSRVGTNCYKYKNNTPEVILE